MNRAAKRSSETVLATGGLVNSPDNQPKNVYELDLDLIPVEKQYQDLR